MNAKTWRPGLGDKIERALSYIPGVTYLPCHDPTSKQLRPESGCAKRKAWLNSLTQTTAPMKINCTITVTDDNNLIFESRGRPPVIRTIPHDANAAQSLLAAVEKSIEANQPQVSTGASTRPAPAILGEPRRSLPAEPGAPRSQS